MLQATEDFRIRRLITWLVNSVSWTVHEEKIICLAYLCVVSVIKLVCHVADAAVYLLILKSSIGMQANNNSLRERFPCSIYNVCTHTHFLPIPCKHSLSPTLTNTKEKFQSYSKSGQIAFLIEREKKSQIWRERRNEGINFKALLFGQYFFKIISVKRNVQV